jgi:hypothetical protein
MNLRVADDSFLPWRKKANIGVLLIREVQFPCHHRGLVNSAGYELSEEWLAKEIDLAGRSRCVINAAFTGIWRSC